MDKDEFVVGLVLYLHKNREELRKRWAANQLLLAEFKERFGTERLKTITLEEYCFKKGNPDSFCYWIENTLGDLGSIHIPHASGINKFHIQNIDGNYVWKHNKRTDHWAHAETKDGVFSNIRSELNKLIKAITDRDIEAIKANRFHQTTKAKITYLYDQDAWIPIYARPHLEAICQYLGVPLIGPDVTDLRVGLFLYYEQIKRSLPSLCTWEFMTFIYDGGIMDRALAKAQGQPGGTNTTRSKPPRHQTFQLSLNEDVLTLEGGLVSEDEEMIGVNDAITEPSKRMERFENQQTIGRKAEEFVSAYLNKHKEKMGIIKIHPYGLEHKDGHHCDFKCEKRSGEPIFIEVKGTSRNDDSSIEFFMTAAERRLAEANRENYFLYYVTDVLNHPRIHILNPSAFLDHLNPYEYVLKSNAHWRTDESGGDER